MKIFKLLFLLLFLAFIIYPANASETDTDQDGINDNDEQSIYMTDPAKKDTDDDGYSDWEELNKGYSPLNPEPITLEKNDFDNDGLSDRMELNFHTKLNNADTDNDGFKDGEEIKNGYDPLQANNKLPKRIDINLHKQELTYFLGDVKMGKFSISSGKKSTPTPKGNFKIINKIPKAWSPYGLWMPYWMGLGTGKFGIHELPYWPNGYREGENHLGIAVSHGCIRLGIGQAEILYNWADIGTPVIIN